MSINEIKNGIPCLSIAGKYGDPNGFGEHVLGWSILGDKNDKAGYYQRRKGKKGTIFCRAKPYWPVQNMTENWQKNHDNFKNGVLAWRALTLEEQAYYNNLKTPHAQTGFTRFMSLYLKTHSL